MLFFFVETVEVGHYNMSLEFFEHSWVTNSHVFWRGLIFAVDKISSQ